ncbi:MAG: hypothetical protein ACI4NA_05460 [Succinivibrio sp.]
MMTNERIVKTNISFALTLTLENLRTIWDETSISVGGYFIVRVVDPAARTAWTAPSNHPQKAARKKPATLLRFMNRSG